jgi:hypothetical protein
MVKFELILSDTRRHIEQYILVSDGQKAAMRAEGVIKVLPVTLKQNPVKPSALMLGTSTNINKARRDVDDGRTKLPNGTEASWMHLSHENRHRFWEWDNHPPGLWKPK